MAPRTWSGGPAFGPRNPPRQTVPVEAPPVSRIPSGGPAFAGPVSQVQGGKRRKTQKSRKQKRKASRKMKKTRKY